MPLSAAETVARLSTQENLADFVFDHIQQFGACNFSYAHAPPIGASDYVRPGFVESRGLPEGWIETYCRLGYRRHDPVSKIALSQSEPFLWRDIRKLKKLNHYEQKYLLHLQSERLDSGICFPTFGPRGRNGYFGIGYGDIDPDLTREEMLELEWFLQKIHLAYCDRLQEQAQAGIELSDREIQVLRLVLVGKSNKEIANDLSISTHSTATYLSRAHEKLSTHDRFSAASRAMTLGLLD